MGRGGINSNLCNICWHWINGTVAWLSNSLNLIMLCVRMSKGGKTQACCLTLTQSVWIGFELILSWQLSNIYGILTKSRFLRSAKFADREEVEAEVCTPKPDTKNQKVKKKIAERSVFSRPRQWRHSWGFRVSLLIKRSVHKYSKYSEYTKYSKLQSCEWNDSIKEITSIM